MDARELTKVVNRLEDKMIQLEKEVQYLKQVVDKQQLEISDMKIDVQMLNKR